MPQIEEDFIKLLGMTKLETEILLRNGFPNHLGEGDLLVGIISKGEVQKNAVLIIEGREVKMRKIQIREDSGVASIEFEVDRNIEPPVNWSKLYNSRIKVKNFSPAL